ncbi:hypothetical protein ACJDU8_19540 [Clostridium sp. WILCCON 0269]|uniref:Uncharacterized protein n=1 Tax=Candidatus Clostridium eludens TaxID=3381663 RepID=A0ABW8SPQ8_9CLOT
MGIYQIDRIQYIEKKDKLIIFEFYLVESLNEFIYKFKQQDYKFTNNYINDNYLHKLNILYDLSERKCCYLFIIIYDRKLEKIYYYLKTEDNEQKIMDYNEFREKFTRINNIDGVDKKSKKLGAVRKENKDTFVLETLKKIDSSINGNDDNGLEITKNMLGEYTTKGFDLDLFQYINSTDETIIYEFLKRENSGVTNYTAHPMRYCWTGYKTDNRQKFISLWNVKEKLNGRLYLINYSDDTNEGIGISEILNLDNKKGIRKEYKYNLTYDEFIGWMKMMDNYNYSDKDYLRIYNNKRKCFNEDFFHNWKYNKINYG